jgi:hypothetical protein
MQDAVMAGTAAAVRVRRRRVKRIRESAAELGELVGEMFGLAATMFRASFYFIMGACLIAAPVAYNAEQHQIADLLLFSGSFLFFTWIVAKWLRRTAARMFTDFRTKTEAKLELIEHAARGVASGQAEAPGSDSDPGRRA